MYKTRDDGLQEGLCLKEVEQIFDKFIFID